MQAQGGRYILVGGMPLASTASWGPPRTWSFWRPSTPPKGQRLIESLGFLNAAKDMDPTWFSQEANEPGVENIRSADRSVVDTLLSHLDFLKLIRRNANDGCGQTCSACPWSSVSDADSSRGTLA